ncbi:hypothetical protein OPV22_022785 [Ensete ventricosum]|uniref:Uncharacterized protein n=1 Tax=Ensete ventricosum TaxID=4639 RepID=A0AAV8QP92_ENSVE|nr:hypothetical protein OPV22_022785 [Ensete ventricosum]
MPGTLFLPFERSPRPLQISQSPDSFNGCSCSQLPSLGLHALRKADSNSAKYKSIADLHIWKQQYKEH